MDSIVSWLTLLGFGDKGWGDELLRGALLSVEISISAYIVGLTLGLAGALAKLSKRRTAVFVATAYTTIIRSVPDILIIFLVYYTATDALRSVVTLVGFTSEFQMNGFVAATLSLGIVQGGYSTEVLRGAITAIPRGQAEAAHALGLTRSQTFFLVILPQMIPLALPGLGNLWLVVLKESSLVSLIGFTELVLAGKMAAGATRDYFLFYCAIALVFLVMSGLSAMLFHALETSTANTGRRR
ncbi:ABC transporter permease [Mesorhizobium sp. NZP2298]|uniref:ABC transporter permease n=1 Tax=Mesorhizobium sp. NZP2298 TaxID=2483403 RepID=UPI001556EE94|nr:ABC transporter permease subunit [Mesorhizobium sp. NZP2298]QKC95561.1 ABC transporter permease subunit [Mesorhizobium sp. NZP2298]